MDEPLLFVHFIITLTCFQNKKGPFCFSKYIQQTALGATPGSLGKLHLLLGMHAHQWRGHLLCWKTT